MDRGGDDRAAAPPGCDQADGAASGGVEAGEREVALGEKERAPDPLRASGVRPQAALTATEAALAKAEALYRVSHSQVAGESLETLLQRVVDVVAETLPAMRVNLFGIDMDKHAVTGSYSAGPVANRFTDVDFGELMEGLTAWVIAHREATLSPGGMRDPRESDRVHARRQATGPGPMMVAPILYGDRALGVVVASNRSEDRQFDRADLDMLSAMASQSAISIEDAAIREQLETARNELEGRVAQRTAELRASEERYRRITETITDFVFTVTVQDGRAGSTDYGPGCVAVTGYSADELSHEPKRWLRMVVPEDRAAILEQTRRILSGERVEPLEHRIVHKDGRVRWVRNTSVPQFGLDDTLVSYDGIIQDITESRLLGEQLAASQKMEAIGRLAGGVAHDFNNLLTAIRGFAELHLADHPPGDVGREDVLEIQHAAERATQLTMGLLAFSRRAGVHPTPLDLAAIVRDAMLLLRRLVGEDIVVRLEEGSKVPCILADPVQIEQVLLNLAANARDAMPTGGTLSIAVKPTVLTKAFVKSHSGARAGRHVLLEVSDTGVGMDETTQTHLFEPFFTTKPSGAGTGLGLASVYGIVKQAEGYIEVESNPGGGSVFRIYLPALKRATPAAQVEPAAGHKPGGGTETILLVEDEPAVCLFAQRVLQAHGYRVLAFGDPVVALDAAIRNPTSYDALVTDVIMPVISGPTLAERIAAARPGLPVLFMSGYEAGALPAGAPPPLAKPFTARDLAAAVGALFGRTD
jgi:PAS domain S-box-containing protein